MPTTPSDSHTSAVNTALTLTLLVLLGGAAYTYLQRGVWPGLNESFDFGVFYRASRAIIEGHSSRLYDTEWFYAMGSQPYQYFPFFAILITPLALLSFENARIIWMVINQIILIASIWLVVKELAIRDLRIVLGVIILFLSFGPMDANMYWGQVNALIMIGGLAAWRAYKQHRPGLCGFLIAFCTIIKITPAIFFVYFLYKRAYDVVGYCLLSGAGMVLFSMIVLGGYIEHVDWFTKMLPFLSGSEAMGKGTSSLNQSFFGTYGRLAREGLIQDTTAQTLHLLSGAAVLLISFALCRLRKLTPDTPEFDLEYAAIACLTVLIPSTVIVQHYVYMFPAFLIVFIYTVNARLRSLSFLICYSIAYTLVSLGAFGSDAFATWPFVIIQSSKLIGVLLIWGLIGYRLLYLRGFFNQPLLTVK
jgi:hypothetical protein